MRTIKDPKKKPESHRRAEMFEEREVEELSKKSTPPKKRKTEKTTKDDSSSLNDSGSFIDNQSDIVSEISSVAGENDISDISSLKSTPPKKRNYNRVINKSPEVNGDSAVESDITPEKKQKPKKKVISQEQSSLGENDTTQIAEKKSPNSRKNLFKQPNDETLNNVEEKKKSPPKRKTVKSNTDAADDTPMKKKPGRKRKLSGMLVESKKEGENDTEEANEKKKRKKTKKQIMKEAQSELKRQTEELRKSQAEKSNGAEKVDTVDRVEVKDQVKKCTKKSMLLVDHQMNSTVKTQNSTVSVKKVLPEFNSVKQRSDTESDAESSDLDTSFESINSIKKENNETVSIEEIEEHKEQDDKFENSTDAKIKCEQCGYVSRSKGGHTRHLRKCQPEKIGLEPDASSKPKVHNCEHCEYTAPKRVLVINHLRSHGIFQCKRCTFRAGSEDSLEEHSAAEHKDRSDCKFCKNCNRYVKCNEIPLEKHMEECQGRIPFKCPECSKEFQYESSLKCHVVSHYPDQPKLFSCTQCDYKSNYKANLKKHVRHIHENRGERNVKCTECDKLFYSEDNMKRHLKLHSEAKPFKCDWEGCDKSFKTSSGLKFHILSHQTDRPFPCEIDGCSKSFKSLRALGLHLNETHQQAPKNYKCEEEGCDMAFYKKCHLDRHVDAHKDNRTHFCTYTTCRKAFRTAESLKVHSLVHTGEKPLKCEHCDFACRQKSSIKFHMKKKHPELLQEDLASPKPSVANSDAATDIYADSINKSDGDLEKTLENSSAVDHHPALTVPSQRQNHVLVDHTDNDKENYFLANTEHKIFSSSTPKKTYLENLSEGNTNKMQDQTVQSNVDVNSPVSSRDQTNSHTVTTSTNDLQEFIIEPTKSSTPKKAKKTDMYEFQSEDESSDEMRPGLLRKDYDKDKPPLPPVDAKLLSDLRHNSTEEKQEPEPDKPQKIRKKPGPKPKPKPEKTEQEVKLPKKRGRKKKSELEKALKVKEEEEDGDKKSETNSEKQKPGKRGRGRSPKAKKEEKHAVDDDDDEEDTPKPQPKRKGRPPKKKPKEDESPQKVPKKRGRKRKVDKEAELKKEQEIVPENGDATINYSEVESNELFGDSTKDSMPDTNEMVHDHDNLQDENKTETTSVRNESEDDSSAFKLKTSTLDSKTEEKKSESESSDIGSDFDEDLKPPPAPRPPPMYDSEDGDIESGPENEEINGSAMSNEPLRDFESSRDLSREISREISRDFESSREIDDSVKTNEYINSVETATPKDTAVHSVGTPGSAKPYSRNDSVTNEHENPLSHQSSIAHTPSQHSVPPTPANQEFHETHSIEPPNVDRIQKSQVRGQTNDENTDESSMPEVDKDYVGRFFEEMQYNQSDSQISRMSSLGESTKSQEKLVETSRSDSGIPSSLASNQSEGSIQLQSPPADLSHKRMDIMSPERVSDSYISRSDSVHNRSSERIPSVPSFDPQYASPLDPYSSPLPARDTILRQPEQNKATSPPVTTAGYMRFPDSEAMLQRQRMTTPYDRNLQNLHRIAEGQLPTNSSSPLLRHMPGREDMFAGAAAGVPGSMPRNPFHTSWTGQDVRPPAWGHPTYLQQQSGSASSSLFGKDSYLPGREFMFDPSRAAAERNMFSTLSSAHSQRSEIPHDTFQFDRFDLGSYLSSHGYNAPPSLPVDYTRSAHSSSQKSLDERYRQSSTGVTDFRSLPPTSSASEMFGVNSSFNFEKFYPRDPMYHSQHIADNANNPFLTGVPSQHSMFGRDYSRSFYGQNSPYPFMNMNDKNYSAASAKLGHSSDSVASQRDLVPVPRPNMTGADAQLQDPYRHHSSMLYNMMNKYF